MPFRLPRSTASVLCSARSTQPLRSQRRFLSSTPRTLLKEDADRSASEIEAKKQEQLDKQKRGEGHWHEELASQGESNIAADKQEVKEGSHDEHISKLQEEGKQKRENGQL
ncbi:hypothetical protein BU24DRAFT_428602 [Aaosphaeria arxii CBS 175.79]|uniref:Mitochondrial carrier n=1 Tax=Aaosphaeria arxii CBS 175.79 TaxID=1450172 RepID=A0A6A5X9R5_9PLEO|nr:uncharacterized protein BU24DRAFT_428602 [Aaosphaeria arxii CBS 175.79]KAF2009708.1 hypothetical protein BU24DRAFT_428602 [Aaosphaeria arxii CBS 175.79]